MFLALIFSGYFNDYKGERARGRVAVWDMQQGLKVGWGIILCFHVTSSFSKITN